MHFTQKVRRTHILCDTHIIKSRSLVPFLFIFHTSLGALVPISQGYLTLVRASFLLFFGPSLKHPVISMMPPKSSLDSRVNHICFTKVHAGQASSFFLTGP